MTTEPDRNSTQPVLNPWFSMWTRPRQTVQQIVDTDPNRMVLVLASLAGISNALDRASMKTLGDELQYEIIIAIAIVGGPVVGMIGLYIGAQLLRWTGKWIGGTASLTNIMAAIAWSNVPIIWALILWIPELYLFGEELFTTETPRLDADLSLALALLGFTFVEIAIGIWTVVVFLKCLGQVQGFSAGKALGNALLAVLIVVVPIGILIAAFTGFAGFTN